jgi:signal transduction histidine kinase
VSFLNRTWARLPGGCADALLGRDLWEALDSLRGCPTCRMLEEHALRETMGDGRRRSWRVELRGEPSDLAAGDERVFQVVATRDAQGGLVVEIRDVSHEVHLEREHEREQHELEERAAENEAMRLLARSMAAVPDSAALLEALCDAAAAQCGATEAMVAHLRPATREGEDDEGVVVAAAGRNRQLLGATFPLAGTLIARAAAEQRTVITSGQETQSAYFRRYNAATRVGPMMLTPLVAHGRVLGVLGVSRTEDLPAFSSRDGERLRVIADHASLALWKAQLFEEAQSANEAKSNFLATISHELRTPLTALTGYSELLADDILGPLSAPQHEVIERMRGVTAQLTTMIDEILTYASLDAGSERVRVTTVDPAAAIEMVANTVEPLATQKGLEFHAVESGPLPRIHTDGDKLRQVLINLAGNAVKFTDRGSVFLGVTSCEGEMRFHVRDTGMGIAQEDQSRLFHPFTQLDTGLTRRHGGTGLGLHICQRLAALLGGHLAVESEVGRGTRFTLVLPLEKGD